MRFRGEDNNPLETAQKEVFHSLYEQQIPLRELLKLAADLRPQYLSLVFQLPLNLAQKLEGVNEWVCGWRDETYYEQESQHSHLTLVEFGFFENSKSCVKEIVDTANSAWTELASLNFSLTLVETEIGRSGINLSVRPNANLNNLVQKLQSKFGQNDEAWYKRGISLIRFLIPDDNARRALQSQLEQLRLTNPRLDIEGQNVPINHINLVKLDKIAENFECLATIPK